MRQPGYVVWSFLVNTHNTNTRAQQGFLNKVALRSHLWGHHPTIATTYNTVRITLTTHDVGGVSDIDVKLARKINSYVD